MNKLTRNINFILIAIMTLWLISSCSNDDGLFSSVDAEETVVTFRPTVTNSLPTRAVSDGMSVDKLIVKVYDNEGNHLPDLNREMLLSDVHKNGVSLMLVNGREYKVLFFAFDSKNSAYTLADNGTLTVDYNNYLAAGFIGMEQLDLFCSVHEFTVKKGDSQTVALKRPTAQLNFIDATTQPINGIHQAKVTLNNIPTSLNLLTGDASGDASPTFTFTDYAEVGKQGESVSVTVDGETKNAWYVSTNYIFVPKSGCAISASIDLQTKEGVSLKKHDVANIILEKNKRTNVLGNIVMMPTVWDGTTLTKPTTDEQNRYIIDAASDIAWLQSEQNNLTDAGTFIVKTDIDMASHEIKSLRLPEGSTIASDDKVHTIKNLNISTGALFGDATDLSVINLNIEGITANGTTHVGALVNTLKGSGTFSGVTVKNAIVMTTNGAAGGMIGYIVRKSSFNRGEILNVSINNCHVSNSDIGGSLSEGNFVGLLCGYDNGETLSFDSDCSATDNTIDYPSMYREGNEGEWLAGNEYGKYNGWLGNEEYYRGIVNYGDSRFIPKWDGKTAIEPLKIDNEVDGYYIYSAFDLAYLQGKTPATVIFKNNVDLGGNRDTKTNPFTPIERVTTLLDGGMYDANGDCTDEYAIYNLYIEETQAMTGFIREARGGTHKNLTFENSSVIVHYITSNNQDIGYAGTLTPYVNGAASYAVENINVNNGYVFGLGKIGGLIGFVSADTKSFTAKSCDITCSTIENEIGKTAQPFKKEITFLELTVSVSTSFYAQGEAGGLIGMIMGNSEVSDCHVSHTKMACYGEEDKDVPVKVGWLTLANLHVEGRHVNNFIGNIRTAGGQTITITDCTATDNEYDMTDGKRKDDPYKKNTSTSTNLVGKPYYLHHSLKDFDTKGSVTIDGVEFL